MKEPHTLRFEVEHGDGIGRCDWSFEKEEPEIVEELLEKISRLKGRPFLEIGEVEFEATS